MSADTKQVIIIGSGPAGYTAAVYLARAQLEPVVFAGEKNGGQLMWTTVVENFPGFKEGVGGPDLMIAMREQATRFGAQIIDKDVVAVDFSTQPFVVTVGEATYRSKTVLIATGATSKMLEVNGERELLGRGVATCAVCDAAFYRQKTTFVVGGGDAAIEDALALTKYANSVTMLVRGANFKASKIMVDRALTNAKIQVLFNTQVKELRGQGKLQSVVVSNNTTNQDKELAADGLFIAIGHEPSTQVFKDKVLLDEHGYLVTSLGLSAKGLGLGSDNIKDGLVVYPTMTSIPGVFGAGDVVDFKYRQAITAAGFGCMAALDIERYLQSLT